MQLLIVGEKRDLVTNFKPVFHKMLKIKVIGLEKENVAIVEIPGINSVSLSRQHAQYLTDQSLESMKALKTFESNVMITNELRRI